MQAAKDDPRQRYRQLVEGAPEIVFALDEAGRITFINNRVESVTGFAPSELVGRRLRTMVRPEDRPAVDMHLRAVRGGADHTSFAVSGASRGGAARHLEISLVPSHSPAAGYVGIAVDVTERRAREREMAERTSELLSTREERERLREFVALIIQAQEEERARIAGDLHDTTVQTLTAIGRRLRELAQSPLSDPAALGRELDELAAAALAEAEEMRRLSRNLRPSVLDHLGLGAALQHLAEETRQAGIEVTTESHGDETLLGDRERTALFRIAQEALTNVRRHSKARNADVTLSVSPQEVTLVVTDDGMGFDTSSVHGPPGDRSARLGLAGMRERAAMLGGTLTVESSPGSGTRIEACLPLEG